jgi:hypothetical protein
MPVSRLVWYFVFVTLAIQDLGECRKGDRGGLHR